MNWRLKSHIQNVCAALPALQGETYYLLQRSAGSLRRPRDPMPMLEACALLIDDLAEAGVSVRGKKLMEIGTGRALDMPLGMLLCGAERVITFDLHSLLKEDLVLRSIQTMAAKREEILDCFARNASPADVSRRLDALAAARSLRDVLTIANIEYRSPADATEPNLPDGSIDIQFSYTVFEHVPRAALAGMLLKCHRILSPAGVALHHIDLSDHFAHEDSTISLINFLQFTDDEWSRFAGNHFAYHNRLRSSDYAQLFREVRHTVLQWKPVVDGRGRKLLENGFRLAPPFRQQTVEDLATVVLRVLSKPCR